VVGADSQLRSSVESESLVEAPARAEGVSKQNSFEGTINIMVAVRIRPMAPKEQRRGEMNVLQALNKNVVAMNCSRHREIDYFREDTRSQSPTKS
jgi:hypothetical protein